MARQAAFRVGPTDRTAQAAASPPCAVTNSGDHRLNRLCAVLSNAPTVARVAAAADILRGASALRRPLHGRWRSPSVEAVPGDGILQMKWVRVRGSLDQFYWDGAGEPTGPPPEGVQTVANPHAPIHPRAGEAPRPGGGGFLSARPEHVSAASFGVLGNQQYEPHLASGPGYLEPVHSGVDEQGRFVIVRDSTGGYLKLREATQYGTLSIFSDAPDAGPQPDPVDSPTSALARPSFAPMAPGDRITSSLTPADVRDWSGVRQGWRPDQQGAMGGLSAADAARAAGVRVTGGYHWLHLVAFSMGGLDKRQPNVPENLLVGTLEANMIHGVVERAAKRLVSTYGTEVELSARPEGAVDSGRHVFRQLHYFIRRREARFWRRPWGLTLQLLDHRPGHHGDFGFVYRAMEKELGLSGGGESASVATSSEQGGVPGVEEPVRQALVQSVQEIARDHGVLEHFDVGHADGRDNNCSILSLFDAAGAPISRLEAMEARERLALESNIDPTGPLDLADGNVADALHGLLSERHGSRQIVVIHRSGRGHTFTPVAGSGPPVFLFHASGHFSPARRRQRPQ